MGKTKFCEFSVWANFKVTAEVSQLTLCFGFRYGQTPTLTLASDVYWTYCLYIVPHSQYVYTILTASVLTSFTVRLHLLSLLMAIASIKPRSSLAWFL